MREQLMVVRSLLLFLMMSPATCFALVIHQPGNKPLTDRNFIRWPNLIDAINDESRVMHVWSNGNSTFFYEGETTAANRVLAEFAETQGHELQVILLPGPGTYQAPGMKAAARADFQIEVRGDFARAMLEPHPNPVYDPRPTMTIYLTDKIDLSQLKLPRGLTLGQLQDLETRYTGALDSQDRNVRVAAEHALKRLNQQFVRKGDDFKKLEEQIEAIQKVVNSSMEQNE